MIDWVVEQLREIVAVLTGGEPGQEDHGMAGYIEITVEEKVLLHAEGKSESLGDAEIEAGSWNWMLSPFSPEGIVTLEPNGEECWVLPTGTVPSPPASVLVVCQGDADLGAGVETVSGNFEVMVMPAHATSIEITADAPVPK